MKHSIKAPSVGESITEVSILKWNKANGDAVKNGEVILEIESDKATVEVIAEATGALKILKPEGERIPIGEVIGEIDDSVSGNASASATSATSPSPTPTPAATPSPTVQSSGSNHPHLSPAVAKLVSETGINPSQVAGTGKDGRVTKGDVLEHLAGGNAAPQTKPTPAPFQNTQTETRPGERRVKLSRLRLKIAERLVHAQHTAAILTTFNEVDMLPVMTLRNQHKDSFKAKNGVPLSFMSFFTKACISALKELPAVNAYIEGEEVVYHDFCDVGIAVGTDRGLVVPVIRNAEQMSFLDIEKKMAELAEKARSGKLSIQDMSGGTFTISNGGVYGSLFSTPILNPPQSAILGMHKIMERPIVVNGKIEVRPLMYLALSYDHRIIDGKEAVTFLVHVKNKLENPLELKPEFING